MCKSAPRSRQITMPALHYAVFTGKMPFLPPNQQRRSTEVQQWYDTIGDAILTCARKQRWVCLIYCMETTTQNKHQKLKPGLVAFYDIWPGSGASLFSKEKISKGGDNKEKVKKKLNQGRITPQSLHGACYPQTHSKCYYHNTEDKNTPEVGW